MKYFIEIDKGTPHSSYFFDYKNVSADSEIFLWFECGAHTESCQSRRRNRVWDPEGSNWVENSQYFDSVAWPQYLKSKEKLESSKLDVKILDSSNTSIEENFSILLQDIMKKIKQ